MKSFAFILLFASATFSMESDKRPEFAIEVIQSPYTLKSVRIAPTIAFENWRFSPGSYLYLEKDGESWHSFDPLLGLTFAALVFNEANPEGNWIGHVIGLIFLGALTCLPNAEYVAPFSLGGIRPSIYWSYNLLLDSGAGGELENVRKIGFGLRKRIWRFDFAAHTGVSNQGFEEEPGLTFGIGSSVYFGKIRFPRASGVKPRTP